MTALLLSVSGAFAEPRTIYVSENGGDDQEDVGTEWAKAYRNIQPAVDAAVEGDTVLVGDGTYYALDNTVTCVLKITNGINVVSVNGPSKTIIDGIAFKNGEPDPKTTLEKRCVVSITSTATGAVFCGFTCTNGMNNYKAGSACFGLDIAAGIASNVVVHLKYGWQTTTLAVHNGAMVYDAKVLERTGGSAGEPGYYVRIFDNKSLIDRLDIRNITMPNGNYGLVQIGAGNLWDTVTLRNAIIANNTLGTATSCTALPISIVGKNIYSVIENCTFVHNTMAGKQSFINCSTDPKENAWKNMRFYNNIMDDYETAQPPVSGNKWLSANFIPKMTNMFFNCCCSELPTNGNNIAVAPLLDENFSPSVKSLCVNAGVNRPWVTNAVDFAHNPRLMFDTVDIGAVECQEDPSEADLACGFKIVGASTARNVLTTTLEGSAIGDKSGLVCAWVFSDGTRSSEWPIVEKTFSVPGRYSCELYVTNGAGETAAFAQTNVFSVLPSKCYVRADNGNGTYPWDTREKGTTNLVEVLKLQPNEIQVADGEFVLPLPAITADYGVKIFSENGPSATTLRSPAAPASPGRYVSMSDDAAFVSGFTFKGGCAGDAGSTITIFNMSAGTISNCVVGKSGYYPIWKNRACDISGTAKLYDVTFDFTGCSFTSQNDGFNTAVVFSGGLMERCKFLNAKMSSTRSLVSAVVKVSGTAVLRNSLIMNCTNQIASTAGYSGAAVVASSGSIENCTFVSNSCATTEAGLWIKGSAAVTNCIIGLNSALGAAKDFCNEAPETTSVSHSLSPDLQGGVNGNISAQPLFKKNTLYLRASSPGSHVGVKLPWMTEDAIDLAGNRRVIGGTPDMGCYESRNPGLMLLVR